MADVHPAQWNNMRLARWPPLKDLSCKCENAHLPIRQILAASRLCDDVGHPFPRVGDQTVHDDWVRKYGHLLAWLGLQGALLQPAVQGIAIRKGRGLGFNEAYISVHHGYCSKCALP